MEEIAKQKVRRGLHQTLTHYFKTQDFSEDEFSSEDKGRIEQVISYVVDVFDLPNCFKLNANEISTSKQSAPQRLWLRSYVTHKLAQMKHSGEIRRVAHGLYRP